MYPTPAEVAERAGGDAAVAARAVVEAQCACLNGDSVAVGFAGTHAAFEFNSVANRTRLGGVENFVSIVRSSAFNAFHAPDQAVTIGEASVVAGGFAASVPVKVGDAHFEFDVARDGGVWATDGVRVAECGRAPCQ